MTTIELLAEALDNSTASLETCLAHFGPQMPPADAANRNKVAKQARELLASLGFGKSDDDESERLADTLNGFAESNRLTDAIKAFARKYGRRWKQALRGAWETGEYAADVDSQSLQQLRNASYFGPAGLVRYRLGDPIRPRK